MGKLLHTETQFIANNIMILIIDIWTRTFIARYIADTTG